MQVPDTVAKEFLCRALLQVTAEEGADNKTPIAHLLLEIVPCSTASSISTSATQLFGACCCVKYARLAVKVRGLQTAA